MLNLVEIAALRDDIVANNNYTDIAMGSYDKKRDSTVARTGWHNINHFRITSYNVCYTKLLRIRQICLIFICD